MDAGAALHPFTRAAMGFALWRRGRDDAAGLIEAAVLAARLAATETRGGALFLPLAQGGGAGLQGGGSAADRLARWLAGAGSACAAALLQLDRVQAWQAGAAAAVADLSGRTPARLIGVLAAWPVVSAPLAAAQTATARATVQRNLTLFTARGLLREITGQGRYRLWTAKV